MKTIFYKINRPCLLVLACCSIFTGCKESFLDPDPLSYYEPETTFSTENGLMSALAICDRNMKLYYSSTHNEMLPIPTEFMFSEMNVASATDKSQLMCDIANMLTPNSDDVTENNLDRQNSMWYFWYETYQGIMDANTVIQYAPKVNGLDESTKNMYLGRAYFHRSFRYMNLVFQYGDVPLVTKVVSVPKENYHSTKRDAILQMLVKNMEFAVNWVPNQSEMTLTGMVNKGACRMLLSKLYLAVGEYQKAKNQLDTLINNSGYSLMTEPFGTFNDGGEPQTWPITRNVIWDLHRPENKLITANKEVILGLPNRGSDAESFVQMLTMRIMYPFFFNSQVKTTDGKQALMNIKRVVRKNGALIDNPDYNSQYDYMRAFGRGIATWRPTWWAQKGVWYVNGHLDSGDLRHSVSSGNWMCMDSLKCNNKSSKDFGKNIRLYDDKGNLLCTDTIRRWYDVPHYKLFLDDPVNEANAEGSDGLRGATNGGNADWYLYRLAEAYLLRAEAKFYLNPNDLTIADDLNAIRKRAHCSELYSGKCTIGNIMDERARELYMEEWRNVELTRVSLCLARSGRPDEWGNTYNINDFDKQQGTDATGGSYWYQRINHLSMYNKGTINIVSTGNSTPNYTMDKKNIYWPIPEDAIVANKKAALHQNFGYSGYDASIPEWDNWEDAVADEDKTE